MKPVCVITGGGVIASGGQRPFPLTDISPILSIQHKTGFPAATGKPVLSFSVVTAPDMSQC